MSVEVIFNQDLLAYPDGFTRHFFKKGEKHSLPDAIAIKFCGAGYCETLEKTKSFDSRETKPAPVKKEVKPEINKTAKKKTVAKKAATKKTVSKKVEVEKQSNDSAGI